MTSTNSDTSSTLSAQTIAGIVIGVVAGVAMVAAACIYLQRWRRSRGRFTRLRKGMRVADPEEEFMSRGSSISFPSRRTGYGHGQQPSVSLEPLLLSPPHTSQDIPVVPIPPDWSYLPPQHPNRSQLSHPLRHRRPIRPYPKSNTPNTSHTGCSVFRVTQGVARGTG